jgi:twitching motility protein PilT
VNIEELPRITAKAVLSRLLERGLFDDDSLLTLLGESRHHLTLTELERAISRDNRVSDAVLASVKSEVSGYPGILGRKTHPYPMLKKEVSRSVGAVVIDAEPLTVAFVEDLPDAVATVQAELGEEFLIASITLSQFVELWSAAYDGSDYAERPELGDIFDVLDEAVRRRASDIHLSVGYPPILRVDGTLVSMRSQNIDAAWMRSEIARIAGIERLARLEKNFDVDMAFTFGSARFRINFGMDKNGYTFAARKIPTRVPTPEEIGLPSAVQNLIHLDRGLVLVTGPTGSGKSTTLASLLSTISRSQSRHIITLEDPVEFHIPSGRAVVHQRELGSSFTKFSDGLRQALRQDPDVVLVGEMRDLETIATALTAAETGHLVLGTLHTYDAASTITRIVSAFPPEEHEQVRSLLSYIVKAIVSQTLLPNLSGEGRVAAFEVMLATPAISNNLRRVDGQNQIRQTIETSTREGMQTLDMALVELVKRRAVSEAAALEKAMMKDEFLRRLHGN